MLLFQSFRLHREIGKTQKQKKSKKKQKKQKNKKLKSRNAIFYSTRNKQITAIKRNQSENGRSTANRSRVGTE
jgi:hypothetical protein